VASVVLVFLAVGVGWTPSQEVNSIEWYSTHAEERERELLRCSTARNGESDGHGQSCVNARKATQALEELIQIGVLPRQAL
jgi:hypothetical protein